MSEELKTKRSAATGGAGETAWAAFFEHLYALEEELDALRAREERD